jgi:signal transduction histidine kinase
LGFVALVHHGSMLGKLVVAADVARRFGEREIGIATAVAAHAADAVDRARAQERERAARIAAEDASRAREEILSIVSHDLRNPLSAILMAAGSLLRIDGVDARAQRARTHAQRVQRNVERMTRLIDDLVDFTAISTGRLLLKKADHAPDDIVRAVVDLFQTLAEPRGLRLAADVAEALPHLRCDHDRVVQAIANLVSNAMKVTGPGGSILIAAALHERNIVFAVKDTGPGIKPDEIDRVFDRYWRTSAVTYKGTGLGLSIARGIVEAHGGKIWAESTFGEGAKFIFSVPGVVLD